MAKKIIEFDGQYYEEGQPIPDIGSWEHVGDPDAKRRDYQGYSTDIDKLPTYDDLEAGSTASCLDTDDYYVYHKKSQTWVLQD